MTESFTERIIAHYNTSPVSHIPREIYMVKSTDRILIAVNQD